VAASGLPGDDAASLDDDQAANLRRMHGEPPIDDPVRLLQDCDDLRCAPEEQTGGSRGFWRAVSQTVRLDESLGMELVTTWVIDGAAVANAHSVQTKGRLLEIPLDHPAEHISVHISAVGASRSMRPLDARSIESLRGSAMGAVSQRPRSTEPDHPMIYLDGRELAACPSVTITIALDGHPIVGRRFGIRRFLPVSAVESSIEGRRGNGKAPTGFPQLRLAFPRFVTTDSAVLQFRVDWTPHVTGLQSLYQRFEQFGWTGRSRGEFNELLRELNEKMASLEAYIRDLQAWNRTTVHRSFGQLPANRTWRDSLRRTRRSFRDTIASASSEIVQADTPVSDKELEEPVRTISAQINYMANDETQFPVRCKLGQDNVVECPTPRGRDRRLFASERLDPSGLIIPFSTEREPSTQGLRSSALLAILGGTMLGLTDFDTSWYPWSHASALSSSESMQLASPFAALLLIFPALLYAQFLQTRPRTDLGNSAQLGLFALLSLMFTLPIVPLIMLLGRSPNSAVSKSLFAVGIASLLSSIAVFVLTRSRMLKFLRWRACVGTYRCRRRAEAKRPRLQLWGRGR
jgi:hypothetical protein